MKRIAGWKYNLGLNNLCDKCRFYPEVFLRILSTTAKQLFCRTSLDKCLQHFQHSRKVRNLQKTIKTEGNKQKSILHAEIYFFYSGICLFVPSSSNMFSSFTEILKCNQYNYQKIVKIFLSIHLLSIKRTSWWIIIDSYT